LVLQKILGSGTFVHALTEAEALACRKAGVNRPITVIPNGVAFDYLATPKAGSLNGCLQPANGRRIMLYIGRLASEKGLDTLIEAWSQVIKRPQASDWILVIAGPNYRGYRRTLVSSVERHEFCSARVLIAGPVYGQAKRSLLLHADCFVLPSRSEAHSVSLLEAMAAGVPCVFTTGCNAGALAAADGGWEANTSVEGLAAALMMAVSLPRQILKYHGENARRHAQSQFGLPGLSDALVAMYRDVRNQFALHR
jgi:glycosyltransferase involved in cell wall biosynthesis